MRQQDRKLFEELGYMNVGHKRMRMFDYIISLTEELMEKQNQEDKEEDKEDKEEVNVVELVANPQSCIYVEAKICYDCGLNRIPEELNIIHKKMRNMKNCNIETYQRVFGSNMNPTIEQSIIAIASYRYQQKHPEPDCNKTQVEKQAKQKIKFHNPNLRIVEAV